MTLDDQVGLLPHELKGLAVQAVNISSLYGLVAVRVARALSGKVISRFWAPQRSGLQVNAPHDTG